MTPRFARAPLLAPLLALLLVGAALGAALLAPASAPRAQVFNPETATLPNGLQVVVIENRRVPVVRQTLFYRVGAADDPPGKSGLAHFLEHMMFKGTATMASGEFSRTVARHGGRDNAFTSADVTGYHQTVAREDLEMVMRMEADRMANIVITEEEAAPELQVVIEERRTRTDNRPAAQLGEHIANALYMHHPYGIPIIGWRHEIDGLTAADARAFHRRHYGPNNAILVVAGDVTLAEVLPLAEKYYGPIPPNPEVRPRARLQEPPHRAARRITMESPQVAEPRLTRDYLAPSHTTGHEAGETRHGYALEVLADILGGGATSRLYRALVVERELALSAGAYYDGDVLGPAQFGFFARPRAGVAMDALEAGLDAEIARLLADGVTEDELAATKKRLRASAVFARDNLRHGATAVGIALSIGRDLDAVEKWPERIAAVTAEEVSAAARHVFRPERSVTGLLLPAVPAADAGSPERPRREVGNVPGGEGVR